MLKTQAIELLGGDITSVAKAIGISYHAVNKWPDVLPPRIQDRVIAALVRKQGARIRTPELKTALAACES